jgi:hypothetical protein
MTTPNTDHRTAPRYALDAAVRGQIGALPFEARLQDVSATGAAVVGMGGVGYENNAFVQLHMDGIGARDGYIRRAIPEGFAVEFIDNDKEQQKKLEAMAKFRAVSA